jgi:hypothetical protein
MRAHMEVPFHELKIEDSEWASWKTWKQSIIKKWEKEKKMLHRET